MFDRGFACGDSLIETLKILDGKPVFLREHFQRLGNSVREAGFEAAPDARTLRGQALSLAELNKVNNGRLRIQLSRGTPPSPAGIDARDGLNPTLLMTAESFEGYPQELYREGLICATITANRGRYAKHKTASLFSTILARLEAKDSGAGEVIFTNGHGGMLEGSLSNLFFLLDGKLVTAGTEQPLLPGVTREKIIGLAEASGLEVNYQVLKLAELRRGEDSAFITSSILGICPVRQIDQTGLRINRELTGRLAEQLRDLEQADIA